MNVMMGPKTFGTVMIRQSCEDYYKIKKNVDANATKWIPRQSENQKKTIPRNKGEGTTEKVKQPKGKLVKVPTNPEKPPARKVNGIIGKLDGSARQKKNDLNRKFYYLRVPPSMSLNAIAVMINTQFIENRPAFVVLASGKKYNINPNFKEASKIIPTGDESGKKREDIPDNTQKVVGDVEAKK